jgi:hypothetical protein
MKRYSILMVCGLVVALAFAYVHGALADGLLTAFIGAVCGMYVGSWAFQRWGDPKLMRDWDRVSNRNWSLAQASQAMFDAGIGEPYADAEHDMIDLLRGHVTLPELIEVMRILHNAWGHRFLHDLVTGD